MNTSLLINPQSRKKSLERLSQTTHWDVVVVGGGATGLGVALDASLRGYQTLLVEAVDFAQGASSNSSKMLHGGVRYLAQGDFSLVYEALHERATVLKNAPHVSRVSRFIIPCRHLLDRVFYGAGLKMYDALAGLDNIGASTWLSAKEVAALAPAIKSPQPSIQYCDGIFDDARLAMSIATSARLAGATLINYCAFQSQKTLPNGEEVSLKDAHTDETFAVNAQCVIHANGAWSKERVTVARGSHIVVPSLGLSAGVTIPKTPDGRVLFVLPWMNATVIGTTDIVVQDPDYTQSAPAEDVTWIINTANTILKKPITADEVTATFVGYRPLVSPAILTNGSSKNTSARFSRAHLVERCSQNTLRVIGGKWTTYRRMAEDALNVAVRQKLLPFSKNCTTKNHALVANETLDYAYQNEGKWDEAQFKKIIESALEESACCADDILYRRLRVGVTNRALADSLREKINLMLKTHAD